MIENCYFCKNPIDSGYTYHWGNPCHIACAIPTVAASQTADPVTNADSRQRVTVKPLVFDDLGIASDDLLNVTIVYSNPADQDRHNAERAARILAALDVQPDPRDAQIAALVEAAEHLLLNYLQDEFDEPDLCVDEKHWLAISDLRAAIAAAKGGDA
jgi:hypothetical protein